MPYAEVATDLTKQEQDNVRAALRFLHVQFGTWETVGRVLRYAQQTLANVMSGDTASVTLAFRIARFASVPLEDLLAGKYPPEGTCLNCGHTKTPAKP